MKPILCTGVAVLGATLILSAPVAHSDEYDEQFLRSLETENIDLTYSRAVEAGYTVCADVADHATPEEVVLTAMTKTELSFDEAGFFAGAAIAAYCPHFEWTAVPVAPDSPTTTQ